MWHAAPRACVPPACVADTHRPAARWTSSLGSTFCSLSAPALCWRKRALSSACTSRAAVARTGSLTPHWRRYRRGVVARRYITHGLVLDVLSALPLEALGHAITGEAGSGTAMALKLLRLPRLLHMSRLLRKARRRAWSFALSVS